MGFDSPQLLNEWPPLLPVPESSGSFRFLGMRKTQEQGCKAADIHVNAGGNQSRAGGGKILQAEWAISAAARLREAPTGLEGSPPAWPVPTCALGGTARSCLVLRSTVSEEPPHTRAGGHHREPGAVPCSPPQPSASSNGLSH